MQDIIQLLPDALANQIAAGEVVQRPASIVKELLENAIDAKAKNIKLIVKDAGKTLVQVIDDGTGMSETDARMSFERHATSKIRTTDDLFQIRTMGFRGEALASIAAVAQVELKTRRASDDTGTSIFIEGSKIKTQETVSASIGTSFSVKNVFFNVPARRNFLKSNPVEMRHILDEFQRVALAHPQIGFQLSHNDVDMYMLPTQQKMGLRIGSLLGKNYLKQIIPCQEDTALLGIQGYIGNPESAKKTRGDQFFFVNKRFIKHPYLHHAVVEAYEGLIPRDAHPFYVIFLDIDPKHIDINIHPTKTEVKFDDERTMYALVKSAVRKALSVHTLVPMIDFEENPAIHQQTKEFLDKTLSENALYGGHYQTNEIPEDNDNTEKSIENQAEKQTIQPNSFGKNQFNNTQFNNNNFSSFSQKNNNSLNNNQQHNQSNNRTQGNFENKGNFFTKKEVDNWEMLYENLQKKTPETTQMQHSLPLESKANILKDNLPPTWTDGVWAGKIRHWICATNKGFYVLDTQATLEKILWEENIRQKNIPQTLLFPLTLDISVGDKEFLKEIMPELQDLGFVFDKILIEENNFTLLATPYAIAQADVDAVIENLLEQFKQHKDTLQTDRKQTFLKIFVKRISKKQKIQLPEELQALLTRWEAIYRPNYGIEGQILGKWIYENDLERLLM